MTLHIYKSYVLCCDICGSYFDIQGKEKHTENPRLIAADSGWMNGLYGRKTSFKTTNKQYAEDYCSECIYEDKEDKEKENEHQRT